MLFYSYFKTLVGKQITVELKNDLAIVGTLHSVDQVRARVRRARPSALRTKRTIFACAPPHLALAAPGEAHAACCAEPLIAAAAAHPRST
jgi:hypothetical protein